VLTVVEALYIPMTVESIVTWKVPNVGPVQPKM
jgi:hypothetical protein